MPRVGDIYSKPAGTTFTPNTVAESAKVNAAFDDLAQDANTARPIVAGGTGANTAVGANDKLNTTSTDIASASTVNLANATGVVVNITGTTTITSLGTVASGALRTLVFGGILTLTHNGTSLILPGGANITTAAGDVAQFRSKGSGNWVCVGYSRASGQLVVNALTNPTITGGSWTGGTDLAIADGGTGASTASAAFTNLKQAASDTATGVVEIATAAEVATGTDTARVPSVATMKSHQGIATAWVNFNGTGTVAIRDSYNVSSITDNGTGDYTINFATALANANYVPIFGDTSNGVSNNVTTNVKSTGAVTTNPDLKSTSQLRIQCSVANAAGPLTDKAHVFAAILGG